jgi:ferredoxin-thioredoxin reductase catalytic subunit
MPPKNLSDTATFASMVATKQHWVLNPDAEFTKSLIEGLTTNWNRYGYFLCPCRDTEGSREADAKVICPCAPSWSDTEEHGHCFCALYFSESFASSGKAPQSIPDRRSQY